MPKKKKLIVNKKEKEELEKLMWEMEMSLYDVESALKFIKERHNNLYKLIFI